MISPFFDSLAEAKLAKTDDHICDGVGRNRKMIGAVARAVALEFAKVEVEWLWDLSRLNVANGAERHSQILS